MRRAALCALIFLLTACPQQKSAEQAGPAIAAASGVKAQEIIRSFALGDSAQATRDFSPALKSTAASQWQSTVSSLGPMVRQGAVQSRLEAGNTIHEVEVQFQSGSRVVRMTFDAAGTVVAFSIG